MPWFSASRAFFWAFIFAWAAFFLAAAVVAFLVFLDLVVPEDLLLPALLPALEAVLAGLDAVEVERLVSRGIEVKKRRARE